MTQDGIAAGSWIDLPHLAQYVRPLVREGLIRERMAHVKGSRRRRKVYDLTESGRSGAIRLRERVRSEVVRVRDAQGVQEAAIKKVVEEAGGAFTALEVLRRAQEGEVVDLTAAPAPPSAFVEMIADAPRVTTFVGRQMELRALTEDDGPRLVVVRGVAGIGKSSLAAKACELLRGAKNLFWHGVRPWDTVASLLADVARFLAALGRPGLRAVLAKAGPDQATHVFREDLPGTCSFLVFDDAHEAGANAVPFFRLLKEIVAQTKDVKAAILTRRALPFYDRRDVAVARTVHELELAGLAPEEVAALFPHAEAEAAVEVGRQLGGHPLFFELVRTHPSPSHALGDLRRFMEEQVFAELTDAQRAMMKLASLYRVAIPREAVFFGPSLTYDVLLSLTERSLIRDVGESRFVVHDTIRDFFVDLLTPTERHELGSFALGQLWALARRSLTEGNTIGAMGDLANGLELVTKGQDRIELLEAFGDAMEKIGDLPGALAAYQEALKLGPNPETVARLHRKAAAALEDRGDVSAAQAELDAALAALGDAFTEERAWVYACRCLVARGVYEPEEAREYGEEALRIFRTLGVARGEAQALLELGYVEYFWPDGDAALAEQYVRSALALAERVTDPVFLANVRITVANVIGYNGQPEEALAHLAAVEATPAAMSDPHVRRSCLEIKGSVTLLLDFAAAEPILMESLALARKLRDSATEGFGHIHLGLISYLRLRFDEARSRFEAAARLFEARGLLGGVVWAHFYASIATLLEGDLDGFQAAHTWLEDPGLSRSREALYPNIQVQRGLECLLEGDEAGVREAFSAALRSNRIPWALDSHRFYGYALRVLGREQEAREHLDRARELARTYYWKGTLAIMEEEERRFVEVVRRALRSRDPRRKGTAGQVGGGRDLTPPRGKRAAPGDRPEERAGNPHHDDHLYPGEIRSPGPFCPVSRW